MEEWVEKGGERDGDGVNKYFWLPGPVLTGSGEGGEEDEEAYPCSCFLFTSILKMSHTIEICSFFVFLFSLIVLLGRQLNANLLSREFLFV